LGESELQPLSFPAASLSKPSVGFLTVCYWTVQDLDSTLRQ
jgi:hypothetical protein